MENYLQYGSRSSQLWTTEGEILKSPVVNSLVKRANLTLPRDNDKLVALLIEYTTSRDKYKNSVKLETVTGLNNIRYPDPLPALIAEDQFRYWNERLANDAQVRRRNRDIMNEMRDLFTAANCVICQGKLDGVLHEVCPCATCGVEMHTSCLVCWVEQQGPGNPVNCPQCGVQSQIPTDVILASAGRFWKTKLMLRMTRVAAKNASPASAHIPSKPDVRCKYFHKTGMCPYGKTCIYAHGRRIFRDGRSQDQPQNGPAAVVAPVPDDPDDGFKGYGEGLIPLDKIRGSYVIQHGRQVSLDMVIPFDQGNILGGFSEEVNLLFLAYHRCYEKWVDKYTRGIAPTHIGIREVAVVNMPLSTKDVRDFTKRTHDIEADACLAMIKYEVCLMWDRSVSHSWAQGVYNWFNGFDVSGTKADLHMLNNEHTNGPCLTLETTKFVSMTLADSVISRAINSPLGTLPTILSRMNRDATVNTPSHASIMRDTTEYVALHYFASNRNNGLLCSAADIASVMPSLRR